MSTTGVKTLSEVVKELKERLGDQQAALFDADIKVFQQTVLDEYGRSASSDDVAKFTKEKPVLMAKIFHTNKDTQFIIGLLNGIVADKTDVIIPAPVSYSIDGKIGSTFTFVVTSIVGDTSKLQYQWYKDGQPIQDSVNINGSTTPRLVISNYQQVDHGAYTVGIGCAGCQEEISPPVIADLFDEELYSLVAQIKKTNTVK